jgi:hypothetical protein
MTKFIVIAKHSRGSKTFVNYANRFGHIDGIASAHVFDERSAAEQLVPSAASWSTTQSAEVLELSEELGARLARVSNSNNPNLSVPTAESEAYFNQLDEIDDEIKAIA